MWRGLLVTFKLFDENWRGRVLGLSPLNGDLFGSTALSYIDDYAIDNYDLLCAIRDLSLYEHQSSRGQAKQLRRVNYEALDVEELGSVYESLLKKRNKEECKQLGQQNIFDTPIIQAERDRYTQNASEIGLTSEITASDVRAKQERYRASRQNSSWYRDYTLCNLWTAAFFMPLVSDLLPTTETLDRLMSEAPSQAVKEIADTVNKLAAEKFFFHWCLEFPEVFQDGGFSCILGNPPWERIKLQEKEFFAARDAEISNAQNKAARERLIKQ